MKHWREGDTENGIGDTGIILLGPERPNGYVDDRVVSLAIDEAGGVTFREECDCWFSVGLTKEDAIEALREAIAWIEAQP